MNLSRKKTVALALAALLALIVLVYAWQWRKEEDTKRFNAWLDESIESEKTLCENYCGIVFLSEVNRTSLLTFRVDKELEVSVNGTKMVCVRNTGEWKTLPGACNECGVSVPPTALMQLSANQSSCIFFLELYV